MDRNSFWSGLSFGRMSRTNARCAASRFGSSVWQVIAMYRSSPSWPTAALSSSQSASQRSSSSGDPMGRARSCRYHGSMASQVVTSVSAGSQRRTNVSGV
ncbi:MAG TPA: hypothetical protein VGH33_23860 [Isosphaeraceae bacterium]